MTRETSSGLRNKQPLEHRTLDDRCTSLSTIGTKTQGVLLLELI